MTISREEFVAILRRYADADPPQPLATRDGVARRIQRHRKRRAAYLVGCALVVVLVACGVVRAVSGPTVVDPTSLPLPPTTFVSYGVTYTRVGVAYLDTSKRRSVVATIPAGDSPVAVFASCRLADPHSRQQSAIQLATTADYQPTASGFACHNPDSYAAQVTRAGLPDGTRLNFAVMDSYADGPADAPAAWAFAIYTVALPAQVPPAPAAAPSINLAGSTYALVRTYTGFWPAQRSVQLTIPAGKPSVISFQCPPPLAGRRIWLPGTEDSEFVLINNGLMVCDRPGDVTADSPAFLGEQRPIPAVAPAPVTFTLTFDPVDQSAAGQWVIGVYQAQ